ncbi:MAG: Rieske (2Fe-2S) protein [Armatimonadota bacterium]|nr:Rieske (2Fe-2S) protein [bacterium]MDW8321681.1 Rieske (2Fe-2S) protein [Armatimonadota bacterium]
MHTDEGITRRQWLGVLVKALATVLAVAYSIPALVMLIVPAFRRQNPPWIKVGSLHEFPSDEPKAVTLSYQRRDGWVVRTVRSTVYVVVKPDGSLKVLSNICTHASCAVRWERSKNAFFCPCHAAYFDADGRVTQGPPPRPLPEYPHKVEGDLLYVRLENV